MLDDLDNRDLLVMLDLPVKRAMLDLRELLAHQLQWSKENLERRDQQEPLEQLVMLALMDRMPMMEVQGQSAQLDQKDSGEITAIKAPLVLQARLDSLEEMPNIVLAPIEVIRHHHLPLQLHQPEIKLNNLLQLNKMDPLTSAVIISIPSLDFMVNLFYLVFAFGLQS